MPDTPVNIPFKGDNVQNALTYQSGELAATSQLLREKTKPYADLLDSKVADYLQQLGFFESKCNQPVADRSKLLAEITVLNDAMLEACAQFERQILDPEAIRAAQATFREKTNPILSKSYCINRCRVWPRGQQGDFETLELAYKNMPLSDGIGYYLDKYLLDSALGVGVRERIQRLRELLRDELKARISPKVLDVACGSCREVFELAPEIKASGARFTCVDLDTEALNFSRDRFSTAGLLSDQVELLTYNALRMFDLETAQKEFGPQDIIYSVGYFDYLPDDFLIKLLNTLYRLLRPDGKLIMAYKDAARYRSQIYHWLVDWDGFKQRIEPDFARLFRLAEIPDTALSMTRVESGSIIFYIATAPGSENT